MNKADYKHYAWVCVYEVIQSTTQSTLRAIQILNN